MLPLPRWIRTLPFGLISKKGRIKVGKEIALVRKIKS